MSSQNADTVFPILKNAYANPLLNEMNWILEAFIKIFNNLSEANKKEVLSYADEQLKSHQLGVKTRAEKIIKLSKKTKK